MKNLTTLQEFANLIFSMPGTEQNGQPYTNSDGYTGPEDNGSEDDNYQNDEGEIDDVIDLVVKFFTTSDDMSDESLHAFAEEHGIEHSDFEQQAYTLLRGLLMTIGKHNDVPDDQFEPEQLKKGVEIESEHTDSDYVAKMIAKDHIKEMPDYYDRLEQMEQSAKNQSENS